MGPPSSNGGGGHKPGTGQRDNKGDGSRLRVSACESRGVTVVEFREIAIVHDIDMGEISRELSRLIDAGHTNIALNFGPVKHMSSQLLGIVLQALKRCRAGGGVLKACAVRPELLEIFVLTNVQRILEVYPDEWSALESDWPDPPRHHPLPLAMDAGSEEPEGGTRPARDQGDAPDRTIPDAPAGPAGAEPPTVLDLPRFDVADLFASPDEPPEPPRHEPPQGPSRPFPKPAPAAAGAARAPGPRPGTPAAANGIPPRPAPLVPRIPHPGPQARPGRPAPQALLRVRLVVLVGRTQGQAIEIREPRFFIGRDLSCQLRAHSPIISRFHALIERRGSRVVLRDLGSSNGTMLGDRMLERNEEVEVADGHRLQIGPMQFRFAIEAIAVPRSAEAPAPVPPLPAATEPDLPRGLEDSTPATPGSNVPAAHDPGPEERHAHPHPFILCPRCGTEGWVPMERLLREFVRELERAWPRLAATAPALPPAPGLGALAPADTPGAGSTTAGSAPPPPLPPAAADRAAPQAPTILDLPQFEHPAGLRPAAAAPRAAPPPAPAPAAVPKAGKTTGGAPPPGLAEIDDFEIPALMDHPELAALAAEPDHPEPAASTPRAPAGPPPPQEPAAPAAPKTPRRRGGQLDLELLCPRCGEPIWAPISQLGRPLACAACQSQLFLHPNGELIVGEAPVIPPANSSLWSPVRYHGDKPDRLGRLLERWKQVPRSIRIAAAAAVVVMAVGLVRWATRGYELPHTLTERVVFVGEAFAHSDEGRLAAIAAPGSERDVQRWLGAVRPTFWRGRIAGVEVKSDVYSQDARKGKAAALAHVKVQADAAGRGAPPAAQGPAQAAPAQVPPGRDGTPPAAPEAVKDSRQISLRLFWVLDANGEWRLDGRRTLTAVSTYR